MAAQALIRSRSNRLTRWLLGAPALAIIVVFVLAPYLEIVVMSFREPSTVTAYGPGFGFVNYARALADSLYLGVLADTLWLGVIVTFFCLLLGFPVALTLARSQSRWRAFLYGCVLSPLLVGVVIRSFGWIVLLANNGLINDILTAIGLGPANLMYNRVGVAIGLVHVFLPFMILPIMNAIQAIDPSFEESARTLGATPGQAFRLVTLPLSMPGVQSGCVLVFILATSAYVVPMLLGGGRVMTTPILVMQQLIGAFLWPFGAALALVLSVAVLLIIWIFVALTRRGMRGLA